jgi:hypothetical protein
VVLAGAAQRELLGCAAAHALAPGAPDPSNEDESAAAAAEGAGGGGPRSLRELALSAALRQLPRHQPQAGGGESLLCVHWVAVPKAMRARRANRRRRRRRRHRRPARRGAAGEQRDGPPRSAAGGGAAQGAQGLERCAITHELWPGCWLTIDYRPAAAPLLCAVGAGYSVQ